MSLMVSISGIRGVVGESLTPEVVVKYAAAYGEFCKRQQQHNPTVILGRDGRSSGKIITNLISSTLLATGVHVRALGICPTPTVALATERLGAAGGISVTASHNPMEWNGMKFFAPTGLFLDDIENRALWEIADAGQRRYVRWDSIGKHAADDSWIRNHLEAVLSMRFIDKELIRRRRFKVVLDCINAAGGAIVPALLQELGCQVVQMHCDVSGVFAHLPEPVPENLTELAQRVRSERADLGIAVDPDVDRLVLITETGDPYGEEYTIASVVKFVLDHEQKRAGAGGDRMTVVVNLSTTRAVDDIAAVYGATVVRTPVGEINVAKRMKKVGAVVGGEGSGGVILPAVHLGRDAIVGIGLLLQMLARSGGSLSQLKATLPQYSIAKGKTEFESGSAETILAQLEERHKGRAAINTDDGLKIDFLNHWVHLRKSNTEPIIRVIAEGKTSAEAMRLVEEYNNEIRMLAG